MVSRLFISVIYCTFIKLNWLKWKNITTNSIIFSNVDDALFPFNLQYSLLHKQEFAHEESIWCVAWGQTRTIDEKSDNEMRDGDTQDKNVGELNNFIVTGSLDDTVKIWDVKDKRLELQQQLSGHSLGVVSVAVSNDGQKIASSSLDSGLCIWKTETGQLLNQAALGPVDIWTVAFSPDDKYVISGSHDGKISLYDVETAKPEQVLDPQNGKFTLSIAYVSDVHFKSYSSYRFSISYRFECEILMRFD